MTVKFGDEFLYGGPEKAEEDSTGGGEVEVPVVNFRTVAENFTVDVIAYPVPHLMSVKHFNQRPNATSVGRSASQNTVAVTCLSASETSPNARYHITVDNMTSNDEGFYQAMIGNDFGNLAITFEVKINAISPHGDGDDDGFPVAAVGGIVAGLLVIALVGAGVFVWNRRKVANRKGTQDERVEMDQNRGVESRQPFSEVPDYVVSPRNARDSQPGSAFSLPHVGNIGAPSTSPSDTPYYNIVIAAQQGQNPESVYNHLQTSDIGVPTIYSPLSLYRNVGATAQQGPIYENSQPASGPEYVNLRDNA